MGTLTLTELKGELTAALGNRTDLDARQTRILNLAQMRIARRKRWEELEKFYNSTVTITANIEDDRFLGLPPNVRDVYSLVIYEENTTRVKKLARIDHRLWDKKIGAGDLFDRRMPTFYCIWQKMIEMFPVPDIAYKARTKVTIWPTAFADASPTAVSDLDQKDDMIIALAASWTFTTLKMMTEAGRWWAIYLDMAKAAGMEEDERPDLDMIPREGVQAEPSISDYAADPFRMSMP